MSTNGGATKLISSGVIEKAREIMSYVRSISYQLDTFAPEDLIVDAILTLEYLKQHDINSLFLMGEDGLYSLINVLAMIESAYFRDFPPPQLTVKEIAEHLGYSEKTVCRLLGEGIIEELSEIAVLDYEFQENCARQDDWKELIELSQEMELYDIQ